MPYLHDRQCTKNPGHRGFIPFNDLTLEHLSIEDRNIEILDKIKKMGSIVVRLVVDKIKNGKWLKITGSGFVKKFNKEYFIVTNNHVVKTEDDVKHCTVEFHYDDDSRSSVLTSRGVKLLYTCPYKDITLFTFHPVHDFLHQLDWTYDKQPTIVVMYKNNEIKTELAGIHLPRFFSQMDINSSLIKLMFIYCQDGSISYIKSSYFKFQPVPSNKQQLTSIQIHIVEYDGNSKVIPGDVVRFGDEFVVQISESIFQDEVKKHRLVWNGEVIGRGIRLYFQPVKASDISRGFDFERDIKHGRENHWIFDCHPIPRFVEERSQNVCCIGHPHGGIKMVTFGLLLGKSLQGFDNQGRHIIQPCPDCQCKEVNCLQYSCKTCPGSSGSAVFPLYEWIEWGSSYSHFLGERVESVRLPNGELVEHISMAWSPS